VRAGFRYISLVEYRTPLYFTNKDSYTSATSGLLTILTAVILAILCFNIFVPIFRKEMYRAESKQIKIRGAYLNGTVESCTNCRNFTVRDALEYTFNGNQMLGIFTSKKETKELCQKYYLGVDINYIELPYYDRFEVTSMGCQQFIYKDDIIRFFEKEYAEKLIVPASYVLDSPALVNAESHGLYLSKIQIKIYGMQPTDNFQIMYKNTEPS
jgi:hypothetical protein